jgi:hypothetical protein
MHALRWPVKIVVMGLPRVLRSTALIVGAVVLVSPAVGLAAAPVAEQGARRASKVAYKLSIDYKGRYSSSSWAYVGGARHEIKHEERVTTYRATTKRSFVIRRSYPIKRSDPRFSFRASVRGSLAHEGSGWELHYTGPLPVAGTPFENYQPGPQDWCRDGSSVKIWPDKTRVAGFVEAQLLSNQVGIDVEPDEHGSLGTRTVDDICGHGIAYPITSTALVWPPYHDDPDDITPTTEVWTAWVDELADRFGRAFTVRYAPGALPDRRNRVELGPDGLPRTRDTYSFSWTARFTPAKRKRR